MTGASKILTVSYGTFSCTLEGFDEPFNTMKAIAEYFRDLAADDRYFGAEPPTPDAAMLHRIAEREIHRRVEAKIQDNGVILRAGDSAAPEASPAPALPALAETDATTDGVAARLQRIRARHAKAATEPAALLPVEVSAPETSMPETSVPEMPVVEVAADIYSEDEHAEDIAPARPVEAAVEADPVIDVPDQLERILDAAEADLPAVDAPVDAPAAAPAAVIDLSDEFADLPEAEDFDITSLDLSEPDETAAEPAPAAEAALDDDDFLSSIASELAIDQLTAAPEAQPAPALETEAQAAEPDALDAEVSEDDEDPALMVETLAGNDDSMLSRLTGLDIPAEPAPEAVSEAAPEPVIEEAAQAAAPAAPEVAAEPKPQKARARVIRIRRVDPAAAAASVEAAPVDTIPASAPAAEAASASALSDEAEAALQAELAALEAELGADLVGELGGDFETDLAAELAADPVLPVPAPEPAPAPEALAAAQAPRHPLATPAADDSLNRLIEHANSEMGGEETRRRQSAIAHLKAAVVATAADRGSQDSEKAQIGRMEAYREDLDRVVRPRRPVSEGSSTARPEIAAEPAQRPTPLVLVSAQRIDRAPQPAAEAAPRVIMPVRPRRVSSAQAELAHPAIQEQAAPAQMIETFDHEEAGLDEGLTAEEQDNVFAEATSFQDFADQLGASALPDLLEAAAVYCAEVLQRPEFSRPLVMRQIASLPGQSATAREDYLRGFGTLLRQGRISKVKRGMFALTDRSPYLAEARKQVG